MAGRTKSTHANIAEIGIVTVQPCPLSCFHCKMASEQPGLSPPQGTTVRNLRTSAGVVTLNVGGRKFVTFESTLTSHCHVNLPGIIVRLLLLRSGAQVDILFRQIVKVEIEPAIVLLLLLLVLFSRRREVPTRIINNLVGILLII